MSKAICAADERLYTPKEAVNLLKGWGVDYTASTLATWRCRKEGPPYLKIKGRAFYTEHALRRLASGILIHTVDSVEA